MVKRMYVKGRHLELLEAGQPVVMGEKEDPDLYQLEFTFESEQNFDKKMNV